MFVSGPYVKMFAVLQSGHAPLYALVPDWGSKYGFSRELNIPLAVVLSYCRVLLFI